MDKHNFVLPRLQSYNLNTLPPELIIYITDFLSSSSIACVGLTCHRLYNLTQERCSLDLDIRPERFAFLNCIARDLPEYIPCHGWSKPKLYRWRHQSNNYYHCDHCFSNPQHRCKYWRLSKVSKFDSIRLAETSGIPLLATCAGNIHGDPSVGGWVTFGLRQLVLRHELLGKEYGVPISVLDHFCPPAFDARGISWVQISPKIVRNGNLMVRKTLFIQSSRFLGHNWNDPGRFCGHTSSDICAMVHYGDFYYKWKTVAREAMAGGDSKSEVCSMIIGNPQESEALLGMCNYPDDQWHRCSILFKCEYCATDTRFFIRKVQHHEDSNHDYEVCFEVYHDFGSLYQPMTIPQRQLIEVATRIPEVHAKYPHVIELHERICQNLEEQYHEAAPLNIRGTAIRAMEEAMKKDPKMVLRTALPTNTCFLSQLGETPGDTVRPLSPGFKQMLSMWKKSNSIPCPVEEWSTEQTQRLFLPFERDQSRRGILRDKFRTARQGASFELV